MLSGTFLIQFWKWLMCSTWMSEKCTNRWAEPCLCGEADCSAAFTDLDMCKWEDGIQKKKKRTWRSTVLEHLFVLVFGFQSENGMSRRKKNPSDVWGLGCVNDFISMEPVTLTFLCLILPLNLYIQYSVMILSQYYYTVLHSVRWCAVLKDRQRHLSEVDFKIYFMWNVSTKGNWRKYNCCIVLYKAGAHVYFLQLSCRKILHLCVCVFNSASASAMQFWLQKK